MWGRFLDFPAHCTRLHVFLNTTAFFKHYSGLVLVLYEGKEHSSLNTEYEKKKKPNSVTSSIMSHLVGKEAASLVCDACFKRSWTLTLDKDQITDLISYTTIDFNNLSSIVILFYYLSLIFHKLPGVSLIWILFLHTSFRDWIKSQYLNKLRKSMLYQQSSILKPVWKLFQ